MAVQYLPKFCQFLKIKVFLRIREKKQNQKTWFLKTKLKLQCKKKKNTDSASQKQRLMKKFK